MFWYSVEVTLLASWFTPYRLGPELYSVRLCWHNYNNIHNRQIYKHMLHRIFKKSNTYPT